MELTAPLGPRQRLSPAPTNLMGRPHIEPESRVQTGDSDLASLQSNLPSSFRFERT